MLHILWRRYERWIRRCEVRVGDGGRSLGTNGRGGIDVVRVGVWEEGVAEGTGVEILCVVVRVVDCVRDLAAVHWEGVDIWLVVVKRESGVELMGVGVHDGHTSTCRYRMPSRRGFGSVFEFDFEVLGANIRVFSADFFESLGFGFV